jgi:hypothetical protein
MLTNALPPPESIYPADIAKRAAVKWGHTHLVTCPTCHGPALVGHLDGEPIAYACHKCGPIKAQGQAQAQAAEQEPQTRASSQA